MAIFYTQISAEMYSFLKSCIGTNFYSLTIDDIVVNQKNESHFVNYLSTTIRLDPWEFVLFNDIEPTQSYDENHFHDEFICFSIVKNGTEPEKIEGSYDFVLDEKINDIKVVTDKYHAYNGEDFDFELTTDIAIIFELETKKVVVQRTETWSDVMSISVHSLDVEPQILIDVSREFTGNNHFQTDNSREINSVNDLAIKLNRKNPMREDA